MASLKKPLVLAVPLPATGHINPFLHLLRRLAAAGFRTALLTSVKSCGAHSSGVEFVSLPDGLAEGEQPRTIMEGVERLFDSVNGMKPAMEDLVRKTIENGDQITCIITDSFISWTHDTAAKFGIPIAVFSTHAAATDLVMLHGSKLRSEGFLPINTRSTRDKLIDFIPGIPPASPEDIIHQTFSEEHSFIDYAIGCFGRMLQAKWILSGSFQAMEPEAIRTFQDHFQAKHHVPIGPVISGEHLSGQGSSRLGLSKKDTLCLEWLDAREPASVVYVSYGSQAILSAQQLMEVAFGLEASQQNFLLIMRPSLIVDDFPEEEFNSFQERTKLRGRVVSWCPQLHVLTHPAVGVFLTHCGWNSTMEGILAGVPMIAWPCMAEQNMNRMILVNQGLALTFRNVKKLVGRAEIEDIVRAAMTGEQGKQVRRNVAILSGEMKKTVSPGGSSSTNFAILSGYHHERRSNPCYACLILISSS